MEQAKRVKETILKKVIKIRVDVMSKNFFYITSSLVKMKKGLEQKIQRESIGMEVNFRPPFICFINADDQNLTPFNPTLLEVSIFYNITLTLFTAISLNPAPSFNIALPSSSSSRHQVQEISR